MRCWTLHPKYLDNKGLCGVWAESIQAKKTLQGKIKMHRNHPQMNRWKKFGAKALNAYLFYLYLESKERGFNFNKKYFEIDNFDLKIPCSLKQLIFERKILNEKLKVRGNESLICESLKPNPVFFIKKNYVDNIEKKI